MANADAALVAHRRPSDVSGLRETRRLSQMRFTDLWISDTGNCLMRGADASKSAPLAALSDEMADRINDLNDLRIICMSRGQHEKEFHVDHDGIRYRVSVIKDINGVWYAIRKPLDKIPPVKKLGLPLGAAQYLGKLGSRAGLIIIAGATGNGKTTTAYSLLNGFLNHYGGIAVTIEDPPEMMLSGRRGIAGNCFQLKLEKGETFGQALESALRYRPNYILMGEIRRAEDAAQALRAAMSGHLVITTLHAGSVVEAINQILTLTAKADDNVGFAREQLAAGIAGILHQKLDAISDRAGQTTMRLTANMLFAGNSDSGVRSKIRDGEIVQLSTEIALQRNLMAAGKMPIDLD